MRERYLTAKELSAELADMGIKRSAEWIRLAWRLKGAPHLQYREVRASDFVDWMMRNPGVRVRRHEQRNRAPIRVL